MQSATMEFDTIAAISTPPGEGAISIVRLSGEQAVAIANKVYRSGTKDLAKVPRTRFIMVILLIRKTIN